MIHALYIMYIYIYPLLLRKPFATVADYALLPAPAPAVLFLSVQALDMT